MPNRTQIVCLHEGKKGMSIDPVFINALLRALDPPWIRPHGSNIVRLEAREGRSSVIKAMPVELRRCLDMGGHTTLMVWADLDHDMADGDELKAEFWSAAQEDQEARITAEEFAKVVFVFAKDRIENWIQFLLTGQTDEAVEGPRLKHGRQAKDAALKLAEHCRNGSPAFGPPPSLAWSCRNWKTLVQRMR